MLLVVLLLIHPFISIMAFSPQPVDTNSMFSSSRRAQLKATTGVVVRALDLDVDDSGLILS